MQCVDLGGRRIIKKKFFQAEDGIRDFCLSRGLGDVYKRQAHLIARMEVITGLGMEPDHLQEKGEQEL